MAICSIKRLHLKRLHLRTILIPKKGDTLSMMAELSLGVMLDVHPFFLPKKAGCAIVGYPASDTNKSLW
ncbi:MAG: hypothetical protein IPM82_21055 [Saprospiraceae bacterium]|nr:hypothetical protein [Saprospiraceae bacterium]